jgi:hypothetical protein
VARNVIEQADYTFDPITRTITINNRYFRPERLMLITNVTAGVVIYNFSDPNLGYLEWNRIGNEVPADEIDPNMLSTEIVLAYNTGSMDATDILQIMVDDYEQPVMFEDTLLDGAQKLRTSSPQSLIDTDFEYSVQPSKWEALFLVQNYPGFFPKPGGGNALDVTSIYGDGTTPKSLITVTSTSPHGLVPGNIVSVQETLNYRVEGTFAVFSTPTLYTFTYFARGQVAGEQLYTNLSAVYAGDVYEAAHIPGGNYPGLGAYSPTTPNTMNIFSAVTDSATPTSNITVTFTNPHGLFPGTPISISGSGSIDGDYYISKVPNVRQLVFNLGRVQTSVAIPATARIIAKAEGYIIHRPYDAGVSLATVLPNPGLQTIRQTRRYFRYQAGKSVQFSTGTKFTPTFNIDSITLNTGVAGVLATVTVQTVEDHGLQVGCGIVMEHVEVRGSYNPYNGPQVVSAVTDSNAFQYQVLLQQTVPFHDLRSAGTNMYCHAYSWVGAATRAGMFDDQNGFWFEFDGQEMYVARRHSEKLIQGRLNMVYGSNRVTGVGTLFREQLITNDMIVIKGSSYKVIQVNSDTSLTIAPAWRGLTANGVRATVTQNIRVPQDEWNLDKCDGNGPSGYNLDVTKMQMIFIDYSWYGAGTIRFGLRGPRGRIIYVHRMPQNNINPLAYQKSGNLPARYEVSTEPIQNTKMVAGESGIRGSVLSPNGTTIWIENTHDWPATGYLWVKDDANCEIMKYTQIGDFNSAIGAYPLTVQRRQTMAYAYPDRTFTFSGTTDPVVFNTDSSYTGSGGDAQVAVQTIQITCSPIIQHWGSSVVIDGRFDADLLPLFTGGMTKYLSVAPGISRPLIALRLAPSVDNALGRNYGVRELVNRMQLALRSIGIQTNGSFRIDCLVNPAQFGYTTWTPAQMSTTRTSVTLNNGSPLMVIGDNSGMVGIVPGMTVTGNNIPANTTVGSILGSVVTLSAAATGTASGSYVFTPKVGYTGIPNDWAKDSPGVNSLAQVLYFDNCGPGAGGIPTASFSISSVSATGTVATFTTSANHNFQIGQAVSITGMSTSAYNTAYAIITTLPAANQFTINTSATGASSTGTVSSTAPSGWVNGGDSVFSFFTENGGGASNYNSSVYNLEGIRELGNSILSGNGTISTPGYPMGPDVLIIQATNIGTSAANVSARISWAEAQA